MPNKINIPYKAERSRWQYFIAPIKSLVVVILIVFAASVANNSRSIINSSIGTISIAQKVISFVQQPSKPHIENKTITKAQVNQKAVVTKKLIALAIENPRATLAFLFVYTSFTLFCGMGFLVLTCLGMPILAMVFMIFAKSYPSWLRAWHKGITEYSFNLITYNWLMIDKLPKLDGSQNLLEIEIPDHDASEMNRLLPVIKFFLVIPQNIISFLFTALLSLLMIFLWPYLFVTGKAFPEKLHKIINGFLEWKLSILSYSFIFTTDEYPKFIFRTKS